MDLRIATIDDLPLVTEMAMKFVNSTHYEKYSNVVKVEELAKSILESKDKIIILYKDLGMIVGMAMQFPFGDCAVATELAWWVEPEARGQKVGIELMGAFEHWAKKIGCTLVTMACLDDEVGKFYEKMGYVLQERAYLKEI